MAGSALLVQENRCGKPRGSGQPDSVGQTATTGLQVSAETENGWYVHPFVLNETHGMMRKNTTRWQHRRRGQGAGGATRHDRRDGSRLGYGRATPHHHTARAWVSRASLKKVRMDVAGMHRQHVGENMVL